MYLPIKPDIISESISTKLVNFGAILGYIKIEKVNRFWNQLYFCVKLVVRVRTPRITHQAQDSTTLRKYKAATWYQSITLFKKSPNSRIDLSISFPAPAHQNYQVLILFCYIIPWRMYTEKRKMQIYNKSLKHHPKLIWYQVFACLTFFKVHSQCQSPALNIISIWILNYTSISVSKSWRSFS